MLRHTLSILAMAGIVVTALTGPRAQPAEVEIADLRPSHVDYPKGPTVIVRNRAKRPDYQAWVIRHLDGVVISRYPLPAAERWQEQVEIAAKGAPLPGEVTATQTTVPFAVVVVSATGEIKASAPFDARVSPASKWPTMYGRVPKGAPFVASGKVVHKTSTNVTIKDAEGASRTYRITDDTTTWGMTKDLPAASPSKGESATLIYSEQGGQDVAKQIAYRAPGALPNPWAPGFAYVGTVTSEPARKGEAFVIETTNYDGRWLIDASTETVFSPTVPSMTALKPGALVGMRVKAAAAAASPTRVEQFFVLTVIGSGG